MYPYLLGAGDRGVVAPVDWHLEQEGGGRGLGSPGDAGGQEPLLHPLLVVVTLQGVSLARTIAVPVVVVGDLRVLLVVIVGDLGHVLTTGARARLLVNNLTQGLNILLTNALQKYAS